MDANGARRRADGSGYVPLPLEFYRRPVLKVAPELIGKVIVRRTSKGATACRIVETEAYDREDPASHSRFGQTPRNASMFEAGGVAYVYLIYGIHTCLNVVAGRKSEGCAVLIRAGEPVQGERLMWARRFPGTEYDEARRTALTSGPGKLCAALGVTRARHDGASLSDGELTVCGRHGSANHGRPARIVTSGRIGVSSAAERPWRFYEEDNAFVSRR